ncbi:MAG: FkbM family methyltransferase [Alphaproteobacteria bacterium]|jgi:FkbM family methyltransferase|nr:FkbM family methyltransferase [Alphaproteobacteria bacterium]MBP9877422.1 FkbM family methyltransferase [Alphaproteobacteria bacterium]
MAVEGFYAQYCEDLILSIVFQGIKQGHYVDVGAHDPDVDSVTKYFYLNGWRGINIEPVLRHYQKLLEVRPNDINLNIAIADSSGEALFSILYPKGSKTADGLSTFHPAALPSVILDQFVITPITVQTQRLDQVLSEHPLDAIHFLKIDVEGAERAVLESIDLARFRPWVMVIEATEPMTNIRSDHKWNNILIEAGYVFKLFDGLNVYYVAHEHDIALNDLFQEAYARIVHLNRECRLLPGEPVFSFETVNYVECNLWMILLFSLVFNEKL